jgi:hypothetical protein
VIGVADCAADGDPTEVEPLIEETLFWLFIIFVHPKNFAKATAWAEFAFKSVQPNDLPKFV